MADKEINLTFETIFETLRREKNREDLQKLDKSFYNDLMKYLKEKTDFLNEKKDGLGFFSVEETQNSRIQLENIKKVIKELYDKRERKILSMALNKSKTNSKLIDTSSLLGDEQQLYEELVLSLNSYRRRILLNLIEERFQPKEPETPKPSTEETSKDPEPKQLENEISKEPEPLKQEQKDQNIKVKFLTEVSDFIGPDLNKYGPFEPGQEAEMPPDIANLLEKKGNLEKLN